MYGDGPPVVGTTEEHTIGECECSRGISNGCTNCRVFPNSSNALSIVIQGTGFHAFSNYSIYLIGRKWNDSLCGLVPLLVVINHEMLQCCNTIFKVCMSRVV